ncbi:MAG: MFS transporter, partial [Candidatus Helarchaeota archaeon]|nr:MFS transporter [Candidatus Helarchaeota archaeon]
MNKGQKIGFNIILLGIVSLITDASSEMIIPLLPFFIEKILGVTIGIGLIIGFIG